MPASGVHASGTREPGMVFTALIYNVAELPQQVMHRVCCSEHRNPAELTDPRSSPNAVQIYILGCVSGATIELHAMRPLQKPER